MKTRLRRPPARTDLFVVPRPPRLVLRFAIVLSLALALASALILVLVYRFAISEAEQAATRHANFVASALLQQHVRRTDLMRSVPRRRRLELDALFRRQVLADDILAVSLVRRDGLVTYSTDHRTIGAHADAGLASEAASGTIVSRTSSANRNRASTGETLETFAPVSPGSAGGAALIVQAYTPIRDAARDAQFKVGIVLEGLLLVLFLVFVPWLARVTRRIKGQLERIHTQAFYDELTGLPNRSHLFELLDGAVRRAVRGERLLAVLLLDLDRFREVNSTLGHEVGDALLADTANRLRSAGGSEALVGRLGGDEFAIVVETADEKEAKRYAERLRAALEPPVVVQGTTLAVDATVGIAFYPKDGANAESLVKHAEVATYTAKEWRVGVLAYTPAVDPHDPEQLELAASLREASAQGQLKLHYQRQVDLATNLVTGFEALAYWNHPTRGLLPPGAFIPVAERTGAIRHVTRAVLAGAIEQLREWDSPDQRFTVSVNLSAIDLLDTKLPRQLSSLLRKHVVDPSRLCIELTERTVMAAPDRARSILKRIVASGVRVSIDDFGTGHSSLAHLKSLPVHEVKIDRSFVTDMAVSAHDRMIVQAAIQLGHSLGLEIVAEGVESSEAHKALQELGCNYAQGYLYGRPEPAESVTSLLGGWDLEAA